MHSYLNMYMYVHYAHVGYARKLFLAALRVRVRGGDLGGGTGGTVSCNNSIHFNLIMIK